MARTEPLDVCVYRRKQLVEQFRAQAALDDTETLRAILLGAVRRDGYADDDIGEWSMDIRYAGTRPVVARFTAVA